MALLYVAFLGSVILKVIEPYHIQKLEKFMSSGYKIWWTHRVQSELQFAYDYLHENWTVQMVKKIVTTN